MTHDLHGYYISSIDWIPTDILGTDEKMCWAPPMRANRWVLEWGRGLKNSYLDLIFFAKKPLPGFCFDQNIFPHHQHRIYVFLISRQSGFFYVLVQEFQHSGHQHNENSGRRNVLQKYQPTSSHWESTWDKSGFNHKHFTIHDAGPFFCAGGHTR